MTSIYDHDFAQLPFLTFLLFYIFIMAKSLLRGMVVHVDYCKSIKSENCMTVENTWER